jgi:uncharacterized low-complexity protein
MTSKTGNTLAVAIGAAFNGSLSLTQLAPASPAFQASDLVAGTVLAGPEGKCGEGKCGIGMMDTDKDGKVSMDEMKAMQSKKMDKMEEHFRMADTNKDGFIDKAEMDAHHAQMKKDHMRKGADMKGAEGSCGGHKDAEGSCGGKRG